MSARQPCLRRFAGLWPWSIEGAVEGVVEAGGGVRTAIWRDARRAKWSSAGEGR